MTVGQLRLEVEVAARESDRTYQAWECAAGTPELLDELWQAHEAAHRAWVAKRDELKQAKAEHDRVVSGGSAG